MLTRILSPNDFMNTAARSLLIAGVLLSAAACSNDDSKASDAGSQFIGEWVVTKIYRHDNEKPPVNIDGTFEIENMKGSSLFKLRPNDGFSDINTDWETLDLQYNAGSDANDPIALVAQVCAENHSANDTEAKIVAGPKQYKQQQQSKDAGENTSSDAIIEADVQYDFTNLRGRRLESLTGVEKLAGEYNITFFHIRGEVAKSVDLLFFYCADADCKNTGMVRGKKTN